MSILRIVRLPRPVHVIDLEIAKAIGIEKALIVCNIAACFDGDGSKTNFSDLHLHFKYFSKPRFMQLLKELIDAGEIEISGGANE